MSHINQKHYFSDSQTGVINSSRLNPKQFESYCRKENEQKD